MGFIRAYGILHRGKIICITRVVRQRPQSLALLEHRPVLLRTALRQALAESSAMQASPLRTAPSRVAGYGPSM